MSDPRKRRRFWYLLGGLAIVAFVAFGATSFRQNITPYVGFDEAMGSGSRVQVAGELVAGSTRYVEERSELQFVMSDPEGRTMRVVYRGVKPGNFEEAKKIVAIGRFRGGMFEAEQLLVKCPSKYQGAENAS